MQKQRPIQLHSKHHSKKVPVSSLILTVLTIFLMLLALLVAWVNLFVYAPPSTQEPPSNLKSTECESNKATDSAAVSSSAPKVVIPPRGEVMNDSTNATVMGMATGYNVGVYKRFVGSLRNSGYKGT